MGKKSQQVLRDYRKRKLPPKYRVQGQNPPPESLPPRHPKEQKNAPDSTKTIMNIESEKDLKTKGANRMFQGFFKFVRDTRKRRADNKKSGGSLSPSKMLDDAEKERTRLWENPPPCGSVIRYAQEYGYEDAHGEFLFNAADVEQELKNILQENPHLANGDEGSIQKWLKGRDESITEPTDVPSIWSRFQYAAENLVRAGKAEIHCRKCETTIEPDQIATNDDSGKHGWNFDRLVCPNGHELLAAARVHVMVTKRKH